MKSLLSIITLVAIFLIATPTTCEAQLLKGLGKKLEKKIEERIERKADRNVDKVLDKADQKTDQPLDDALNKAPKSTLKFEDVASRPDQSLIFINNNCNDFSWFKKGAVLEYEVFDGKGKLDASTKMEVKNLSQKGTATVAEVESSIKTQKMDDMNFQMKYICDGDKFYMDLGAMMDAMMKNNPELNKQDKEVQKALENTQFNFDNGFASFPKKMYPGMKLDDLNFSIKTKTGTSEMVINSTVSDRQVIAKETITTKAGTFDCLKIRSVTSTTMKVMGFNQNMPQSVEYLWIAPTIGMVKQESTQASGKLTSSMQLKSFKM